jgi:hypothetical protein
MPNSTTPLTEAQRQKLDALRPAMAKALNKHEQPWREQVGHAIARTFALANVSQKEAGALLNRDPAQIARWISSAERPSIDVIFSVKSFRGPLVIALAQMAGVKVTTHIEIEEVA